MLDKISIHNDFSNDLKKIWDTLANNNSPFLKFYMHKEWFDSFGHPDSLIIINHSDKLIVPVVNNNGNAEITGGQDLFDFHDFVYSDMLSFGKIKDVFDYCFSVLKIKKFTISSVIQGSPIHNHIAKLCQQSNFELQSNIEDVSPYIILPSTFEEYLMQLSKKNRHEIRRKINKLELSGEVSFKTCSKEEVKDLVNIFFELMLHNPEKEAFLTKERKSFMKNIIINAVENNFGELNFLNFNNKPVATTFVFKQSHKISVYNSGYDPSYSYLSVGLISHILNIKKYVGKVPEIDFLRGSEDYKFRIGCISRNLLTLEISN